MSDERAQELELLPFSYPEITISENSATLKMPVDLECPLQVNSDDGGQHSVLYLPSLTLSFALPNGYPADCPPCVRIACSALPNDVLDPLEAKLAALWEEYGRVAVITIYISEVTEAINTNFGIDRMNVSQGKFKELVEFDSEAQLENFKKCSHVCDLCIETRPGQNCHRMTRCGHIFCVDCLQSFYSGFIKAGDVNNITCLEPDCGSENDDVRARRGKKKRLLSPRELLQIPLERHYVQRYVDIKRKKRLDADKTTVWCPRTWCQGASKASRYPKSTVPLEEMNESDTEDESTASTELPSSEQIDHLKTLTRAEQLEHIKQKYGERLHVCEDCGFAFCKFCKHSWHGEGIVDCLPERLNDEISAEEKASLAYIATHTTPCPRCAAPISKIDACNHVTCYNCLKHLCYLCGMELDSTDPYKHFNTKGSSCYQKLFPTWGGDAENQDEFAGVRAAEIQALRLEEEERERRQREADVEAQRLAQQRREEWEARMGAVFPPEQ
ncbi:hypothetical protein P280DRAFT_452028 [Massarina eburnea CBS 473.64]|uniref:RBR-type E3 ubiquitin transferase n=1 Tax=Massarina eburnea CBS 473.64 TaxID=1395130 RepID=A0A6A6RZE8_9PLEO|nr:hypothetical protein P280DRAFT_452028 [Massarina eburnea CBS 473.64]